MYRIKLARIPCHSLTYKPSLFYGRLLSWSSFIFLFLYRAKRFVCDDCEMQGFIGLADGGGHAADDSRARNQDVFPHHVPGQGRMDRTDFRDSGTPQTPEIKEGLNASCMGGIRGNKVKAVHFLS